MQFKVSCIADYKNRNKREKKEKKMYGFRVFTKPAGNKHCQLTP